MSLGAKVKNLRKEKKITIKEMAEMTSLSTGFISQFERGITTIDVDHLHTIASILDVDISYFFLCEKQEEAESVVVRRYERPIIRTLNQALYFGLSSNFQDKQMAPKYVELLPAETKEAPASYGHPGEEFIFVLEGTLTLYLEDTIYKLYPGDAVHYLSTREHNWGNNSDSIVKFIVVHFPNTKE
ncbi:XRE family transcriptional regulator [Anaerospora sp.]|jgi:transcriptional regulator with XRE-family HTH domain|uniref:helix-turn-helix domain-containing protein n=1 Tax=Anaerospora sp. TaxID=1960278 RepID=UPI00289C93BC|nr:XRE family transcriptional regulator [Anaerospora sp.]